MIYYEIQNNGFPNYLCPKRVIVNDKDVYDVEIEGNKIKFREKDGYWDYHNNVDKDLTHRGYTTFESAKQYCLEILEEEYNKKRDLLNEMEEQNAKSRPSDYLR